MLQIDGSASAYFFANEADKIMRNTAIRSQLVHRHCHGKTRGGVSEDDSAPKCSVPETRAPNLTPQAGVSTRKQPLARSHGLPVHPDLGS